MSERITMTRERPTARTAPALQRKCACGGSAGSGGECAQCKKKNLQRRAEGSGSGPETAPPIVNDVLRSPGQPLDAETRGYFEPRFGHDFSKVRVHTDAESAESAHAVNALAYTVGQQIVFGAGLYQPNALSGKRMLAHELTHVVQQGEQSLQEPLGVGDPHDTLEREADQQSATVLAAPSAATSALSAVPLRVQRLGSNPTCTKAEADGIHQAIYDARGWLNKAIPQLEAAPLSGEVVASLRKNFGPTYGVAANAGLIHDRLKVARSALGSISFACDTAGATDFCVAQHCGWAAFGSNAATICTNAPSTLSLPWPQAPACVLHESMHASMSFMVVDWYKTNPGYPGVGTEPLKNPDSYTFLVEDLS
jgi:Domain of unknown function (DUF4157)